MSQANPDRILVSKSGAPIYGRTDGVGVVVDSASASTHKGLISVVGGDVGMPLDPSLLCYEFHDFNGLFILPDVDTADGHQGTWCVQSTGTTPTLARKADFDCGALELKTSNTSEVADLTLYWGDEQNIDSDLGPILIARVQVQTQPAAADSICWGFGSARNALQDSVARNAWFKLAGANLDLKVESDDATTDDDDNDTTVDLTAGTFIETMVSMNRIHGASATDVRFFYRTTLGGAWTRVLANTTFVLGADQAIQPYFQVEKTSGTTTPDLLIDYAAVIWERA